MTQKARTAGCSRGGHQGVEKRPDVQKGVIWHIAMRIRAKVEHPLRVLKRQFGYTKVRYRGLKKNTLQLKTLFALSNLWMVRHQLLAERG